MSPQAALTGLFNQAKKPKAKPKAKKAPQEAGILSRLKEVSQKPQDALSNLRR